MHQCVIAPSPASDWQQVPLITGLARQVSGTLFRKHILNRGTLLHPTTKEPIMIDDEFVASLKRNFDSGVADIVQVPLANDKNEHVESPDANLGEVVGIEDDSSSGKVYALVDARMNPERFGKTYLGASAFMHLNYPDSATGEPVGPTLLHVAVTNRPYVTGLDPYEAVAAAAERFSDPVVLSVPEKEGAVPRTVEEILAELKEQHGVDVAALRTELAAAQERLTGVEDTRELAERIATTLQTSGSEVKLSSDPSKVTTADLVTAVAELVQTNVALSNSRDEASERIAALENRNLEQEIDGYVAAGRIVPAQRDDYLKLAGADREMFDRLLPKDAVVALNVESGQAPRISEHQSRQVDVDAEVTRYTAMLNGS